MFYIFGKQATNVACDLDENAGAMSRKLAGPRGAGQRDTGDDMYRRAAESKSRSHDKTPVYPVFYIFGKQATNTSLLQTVFF